MDVLNELNNLIQQVDYSIKKLSENGRSYAEAERDYKIELMQEVMKLRDEKIPVTLIQLVAYGKKNVAEKRFERDCKEAIYKANQESINVTKLKIRVIENQLQREYANTDRQ